MTVRASWPEWLRAGNDIPSQMKKGLIPGSRNPDSCPDSLHVSPLGNSSLKLGHGNFLIPGWQLGWTGGKA